MDCLLSTGGSLTCLVCQNEFEERKQVIPDVVKGFVIFTKILGAEEEEDEDSVEEGRSWEYLNGCSEGPPCCSVCCGALISILRSQEIIEQNLAVQSKNVATLRDSLVLGIPTETGVTDWNDEGHAGWREIRNRLIECALFWNGVNQLKDVGKSVKKPTRTPVPIPVIKPCSVVLDRISKDFGSAGNNRSHLGNDVVDETPESANESCSPLAQDDAAVVSDTGNTANDGDEGFSVAKRPRRGVRSRRTVNPPKSETDDCGDVANVVANDSDDDFRPPAEDHEVDSSDADYRPPPGSPDKKKSTKQMTNRFNLISDKFLLYCNTPVQYSNAGFTCFHFGCSETFQGIDYEAFQKLKAHIKDQHCKREERKLKTSGNCPVCAIPLTDVTRHKVRTHILSCHKPSQIVCEVCWKPQIPPCLPKHLWKHKNSDEKAEAIANGKKDPTILTNPKKPQLRSSDLKYSCEVCGKLFRIRSCLRRHEQTHLRKELREHFRCPYCPRSFLERRTLNLHFELVHNKEARKSYQCHICDQRFPGHTHFQDHLRLHSGETPFQCEQCGKQFAAKKHLKLHAIVHNSEKPYQCEQCAMKFKHRRNLNHHQRKVHKDLGLVPEVDPLLSWKATPAEKRPGFIGPIRAYPCEYCEKIFKYKCYLDKHTRDSHAD